MPPPYDNRADALVIALDYSGTLSTVGATDEVGEPLPGSQGATIWLRFTIAEELLVSISLEGSDYDTYLALYPQGSDTWIAENDDAVGLTSAISENLTPGTYDIQIGGYGGDTGTASVAVTGTPPPPPPATVGFTTAAFNTGEWSLGQLVAPLSDGYFLARAEDYSEPTAVYSMVAYRIDLNGSNPAIITEVDRVTVKDSSWIPCSFAQTAENHVAIISAYPFASNSDDRDWLAGVRFNPATETLTLHENLGYVNPGLKPGATRTTSSRTMPVGRRLADGNKGVLGLSSHYSNVPDPWNLSTLHYTQASGTWASPNGIFSGMEDVYFKPDGTRAWLMRGSNRTIEMWNFTTPWDVRTAVYGSETLHTNFNPPGVSAGESDVGSIWMKPDGTRLYGLGEGVIAGSKPRSVIQWDTTVPWSFKNGSGDPSANTLRAGEYLLGAATPRPVGLHMKPDGTRMYVLDYTNRAVYQYNLSTAWNVTTATAAGNTGYQAAWATGADVELRRDGLALYVLSGNRIYERALGTAWDVTTIQSGTSSVLVSQHAPSGGMHMHDDGYYVFVVKQNNSSNSNTLSRYDFGAPETEFVTNFVSWGAGDTYPTLDAQHAIPAAFGNIDETALDLDEAGMVRVVVPVTGGGHKFYTVDPVAGPTLVSGVVSGITSRMAVVGDKAYWWGYSGSDNAILSMDASGTQTIVWVEQNVPVAGGNGLQSPQRLANGELATVVNYEGAVDERYGYNGLLIGNDLTETLPLSNDRLFFVQPFPNGNPYDGFSYPGSPACDPVTASGIYWHKVGWDDYSGNNNLHEMRFIGIKLVSTIPSLRFLQTDAETERMGGKQRSQARSQQSNPRRIATGKNTYY